jgi:hypothetical protein
MEATKRFYDDYSKFVLRSLKESRVWSFVGKILGEQGIESSKVKAVRIMVYPFGASEEEVTYADCKGVNLRKKRYCGHYIPSLKRIDIYPPWLPLLLTESLRARSIWRDEDLRYFFFCLEPVKTLIHEYLHVKYRGERTVRQLSKRYLTEFERGTTRKVVYSDRKLRHARWLELFILAHEDVASQLHSG